MINAQSRCQEEELAETKKKQFKESIEKKPGEAVARMMGRHSVRYYKHFVPVERYIMLVGSRLRSNTKAASTWFETRFCSVT